MTTPSREWGPESSGCQLSIRADKRRYQTLEAVHLEVVFRNNGQKAVRLGRVSEWFDYEWSVRRADGAPVALTPAAEQQRLALQAGGGGAVLEVAGGKEVTFSIPLSEIFDFTQGGEMEIEVSRNALDQAGNPFRVVSNRIGIVLGK